MRVRSTHAIARRSTHAIARRSSAAIACALVVTAVSGQAHAGIAWGDASLRGDDVRVDIDASAHALVTHVVTVHVAAKKFRAFVLDGVDDKASAPLDEETAAGMDGPGWPATVVDDKSEPFAGFVEPAKEPRRLRVHLGQDGIPRGDYVITLRYRADLSSKLGRDGANATLRWRAPSWPEGYDNGRIVFVLPTATLEPHVSLVDGAGGAPRSIEGAALLDFQRKGTLDELTLTRPHVPHHDDVEWVLSFDPRAMPEATAKIPANDAPIVPVASVRNEVRLDVVAAIGAALTLLGALVVARRDRDAMRIAAFRRLVPFPSALCAALFGLALGGSVFACAFGRPWMGACALVVALLVSTLRPPAPIVAASGAGRWLAMPPTSVPKTPRPRNAPFDPGTRLGGLLFTVSAIALVAACLATWRLRPDFCAWIAMHGLVLLAPFATGRHANRTPDLVGDAWKRLRPIARTLERAYAGRTRVVGHVPRHGTLDEIRLRVVGVDAVRDAGLIDVEIGCAIVAGFGASSLVPEMIVRLRAGSNAMRAFEERLRAMRDSATFGFDEGRGSGERVLFIRPALVSPAALRRWIAWIFQLAVPRVTTPAVQRTAA